MDSETAKRIDELEQRIDELSCRRIYQQDITNDSVKERHVGEGVRFIRAGLAADRPTSGELSGACYYETDTKLFKLWDGSAWQLVASWSAVDTGWAVINKNEDKTLDCNVGDTLITSDVLGTLIDVLITTGIISA